MIEEFLFYLGLGASVTGIVFILVVLYLIIKEIGK